MPKLRKVEIGKLDKEMIPVIRELNRVGLRTIASCSGHGTTAGYIAIDLASTEYMAVHNGVLAIHFHVK